MQEVGTVHFVVLSHEIFPFIHIGKYVTVPFRKKTSVPDPDPDPKDPLHFGPLRSGSGSGSSSLFSTSIRSIIILHIKLVSKDIQTFC